MLAGDGAAAAGARWGAAAGEAARATARPSRASTTTGCPSCSSSSTGSATGRCPSSAGARRPRRPRTPGPRRARAPAGASGWHLPFGWGRAPSSELAHWAMFGFADVPFPGRAVLEALGAGVDVPTGVAVTHAALRTSRSRRRRGGCGSPGGSGPTTPTTRRALLDDLARLAARHGAHLTPLARRGEALLALTRARERRRHRLRPVLRGPPPVAAGAAAGRGARGRADSRSPGRRCCATPAPPCAPTPSTAPAPIAALPRAGRADDEVVGRAGRRSRRSRSRTASPAPRSPAPGSTAGLACRARAWRRGTCDPVDDVAADLPGPPRPPRTS